MKSQASQKKTVYEKEKAAREAGEMTKVTATAMSSVPTASSTAAKSKSTPKTSTPVVQPAVDPAVAEITKQLAALTLLVQANVGATPVSTPAPTLAPAQPYAAARTYRCMWCDSPDHRKDRCGELTSVVQTGRVRFNEKGYVVNAATGEEIPPMFGRGGMKVLLPAVVQPTLTTSINQIMLMDDEPVAELGNEGTVCVVTVNDDGTEQFEYIDANVEEKRKRDDVEQVRQVRQRLSESPTPGPSQFVGVVPPAMPRSPAQSTPAQSAEARVVDRPMYRNLSAIGGKADIGGIVDKVLKREVNVTVEELLATSSEVRAQVVELLRNKRQIVEGPRPPPKVRGPPIVNVNHMEVGPLYACASPRVKVTLERGLMVTALIDDGSEISIMPRRVFERLNIPIDTEINWKINTYEVVKAEAEGKGLLGVCHAVHVNVGGVEVEMPIFVVEDSNSDLLLGRPWEQFVQAQHDNRADGSLWIRIQSADGRRVAQFCAVAANHERNRSYARHPPAGMIGADWGKV
jgi:predicted aspartyl protease